MSVKMRRIAVALPLMILLGLVSLSAQSAVPNPVPQINQPLVPMSTAPGATSGFTLTVNGTGFVATSQVNWNGGARTTTFVSSTQLTAAILDTDIAAAGTALVTVVNPAPGGGASNAGIFEIISSFSPVAFGIRGDATGSRPIAVATADLNGDGKLDLAVANYSGSTVSILLSNGDGTFQIHADYTTGSGPRAVTAGDFNGDGNPDLAVANYSASTVSVLLGNGDGTFQSKVDYVTGTSPHSVAAGDFNADGKLDLAVANYSAGTVSVLLGNGDGTFQAKVDYATGASPRSVAAGDFNADGKLDLAVANYGSSTASVLLGNGDGTFQATVDYSTGYLPFEVKTVDLNADGKLDLAVANYGVSTISVLLGNGDGTFQTNVDYSTGSSPYSVTTGDFNGDGTPDLASGNAGGYTVSVLVGNGDGTFQAREDFSAGDTPYSIAAGDFNGDGMLDLAAANYTNDTVSVLLQGPVADLSTSSLPFGDQIVATSSASQPVTLSNTGNKPLSITDLSITGTNSGDFGQTNDCPQASLQQTLAAGGTCTINVTFTPTALGDRSASVTITDDAEDSPQAVDLTGRGVSAAGVGLTSGGVAVTQLAFGDQVYNTPSAAQTVTLTNTGAGAMGIASITTSIADFGITHNCPASLDIGLTCDINVTFTPSTTGYIAGTLNISDDSAGSPHSLGLNGTGIAAQVSLSPSSLQFSDRGVGTTSPPQSVTLTNIGQVTLNIASIAITGSNPGDFAQTNNCGGSVAVGASCTFQITFTPTAVFGRSGQVSITDDAPGSPHSISVYGTGYVARLSPEYLDFDEQGVGTTSPARNLTLSNTGQTAIAISNISVPTYFSQTNTCGTSLAAGSRCTISVTFQPTEPTYAYGSVTVTSDAPDGTLSVSVQGVGVALGVSPRSFSFAGQPVGATSASRSLTLTNYSQVAVGSLSFAVSSPFAQTNNCGASLAAGASCTAQITFTPASAGTFYGSVTISSDSPDGTRYVDLNGTGVVLTASPRPVLFPVLDVGATSAAQTVTLTNTGQTDIAVSSLTPSGDFAVSTDNCGATVAAGSSCTVALTFTPTALGPRTGYLTIASSAPDGTLKILLIGASGIRNLAGFASNVFPANDDGSTDLIPIGFTINYFGNQYSALYVNNNGDVTFDSQLSTYTPFDLTSTGQVIMAPFFGDVDTRGFGSGVVTYGQDTVNGRPAFGVNWFDVGYYGSHADKLNIFQLVIINRSDVAPGDFEFEFNYAKVQWETGDASSGSGGLGGYSARAGYSNGSGNPDTFLEIPGSAINGALIDSNTDTGLIHNSFNSTQLGRYLFNGRGGGVVPPGLNLSPAALTLPGTPLDLSCLPQPVTVSNTSGSPLTITNVISSNPAEFVATNQCPSPINPGMTCTISVQFHPAALGVRQGTLTVESDDPRGPQSVALSGEGLPACSLVASRRSALVLRGTTAADFNVSDASPSCSPDPIELSCANNDPATCTFSPAVIPPSGRSALRVGNLGALRGDALNFVVNSRSAFRTAAIGLSVLVKDFAFTTAPDSATVGAGETASYALSIRPVNGFAGAVSLSCSGAPRGATCTVEPGRVTLDGLSLAQVRVNVRTTARGMAPPVGRPDSTPLSPWTVMFLGLLMAMLAVAASRRRRLVLGMALLAVMVWAACGGGGMVSSTSGGGTPPGTSALTITGTYTTTSAETAAGAPSQVTGSTAVTLTVR